MRNRLILNILVLCITVITTINSSVTNPALAQQTIQSVGFSCFVYASDEKSAKDSQLLAINLRTKEVAQLGQVHEEYNIEGLAINSTSETLYAISGQASPFAGNLFAVDLVTGELNLIGDTNFRKLSGLAIHPADGTLWSWEKGMGLIKIDPNTGASILQFSSPKAAEDLAWSPDGLLLYAILGKSLYIYAPDNGTFEKVATNLPSNIRAAEIRPDGLLLISRHQENRLHFATYDPVNTGLVTDTIIPGYDDIEAIAWPSVCGNASSGGEADIIKSVTVDKSRICSGESVYVSVSAEHPESPNNPVEISINGQAGTERYLQFTGAPGVRQINVTAGTKEKYVDLWEGQVKVIKCNKTVVFPIVGTRMNQFKDLVVDIDVLNFDEFEADMPVYIWEFGDGQTTTTSDPFISHDYSTAIDMQKMYTVFQAKVTVQRQGHPDVSTPKTLTVWNTYALNKERGIIQPRVTYEPQLTTIEPNLVGVFSARNFEDEIIQFTSRQVELQPCDPNQDPILLGTESYFLELAPNQELASQIEIPIDLVSVDICDIAIYLTGTTASQIDAYISLYFAVQENYVTTQPLEDLAMEQLLNDIVERGLVVDPYNISEQELYDLARAGKIVYPPLPISESVNSIRAVSQEAAIGEGILDERCNPDEEPPRPGITCQATGEWEWAPAHIPNAHKGDIIVGVACGVIRGLLQHVEPPQRYSHTGIMTQNFYQIRHSTATEERYKDYKVGSILGQRGTNGIRVDIVKYGWPGTVTQTIADAFNGGGVINLETGKEIPAIDRESGKEHKVSGFAANPVQCEGDTVPIYPQVVKPPPGSDPTIRKILRSVADAAQKINGHYRFYAYTDGSISGNPSFNGTAKSGWANETLATVCTTFIWTALKTMGINLEGSVLEPKDFNAGAERDASTLDGFYFYTEPERDASAEWLWDYFYDLAYLEAEWWGTLFSDAPTDLANEMVNCFANDTCDRSSTAWWRPGVGRTVSPDNIIFWDSPETGGVYGYSENLFYRATVYRAKTTWQESEGVGAIAGQVLLNGNPVQDASINILTLELFTNQYGEFQDGLIPEGTYSINAAKIIDDRLYYAESIITVQAGQTTYITLNLEIPPFSLRQIIIEGTMKIHDAETGGGSTETFEVFESRFLSPDPPPDIDPEPDLDPSTQTLKIKRCVDDEVSAIITMTLTLLPDLSVEISTETKLYDDDGPFGYNCYEGDDVEAVSYHNFLIPMDTISVVEIPHLEDDRDWVEAYFVVSNVQQP